MYVCMYVCVYVCTLNIPLLNDNDDCICVTSLLCSLLIIYSNGKIIYSIKIMHGYATHNMSSTNCLEHSQAPMFSHKYKLNSI